MDPFDPARFVAQLHALFERNAGTGEDDRQPALAEALRGMLGKLTDADLLCAYQQTNGEPDNPETETVLAEIERRNLDI